MPEVIRLRHSHSTRSVADRVGRLLIAALLVASIGLAAALSLAALASLAASADQGTLSRAVGTTATSNPGPDGDVASVRALGRVPHR